MGVRNPYLKYSDWGWAIAPDGSRYCLNLIYDRYQTPVMVVENGFGAVDRIDTDGSIHDTYRIDYLKQQIQAKEQAIRIDGVHLIGYTPWSAFDIVSEMEKRYGFIYVDKQDDGTGTFDRIRKDSFYWYQKVIRSNGETL